MIWFGTEAGGRLRAPDVGAFSRLALELSALGAGLAVAIVARLARAGLALVDVALDATGVNAVGAELALDAVARAVGRVAGAL